MNTKRPLPPVDLEAIFDAVVRVAVREDMARVYGEPEPEPQPAPSVERPSIFLRRQAD